MPFPTMEKLRQQCRIDSNHDAEDSLLNTYARAAIRRAENYLNRRLYEEVVPDTDPDGLFVSDDVELAIMLTVGYWYENREAQTLSTPLWATLSEEQQENMQRRPIHAPVGDTFAQSVEGAKLPTYPRPCGRHAYEIANAVPGIRPIHAPVGDTLTDFGR